MTKSILFVAVSLLALFPGCGQRSYVSGTVSFEDGAPVTFGSVCMESDQVRVSGAIDSSGRYSVGMRKDGDGTPPGRYKVWIVGSEDSSFVQTAENKGGYKVFSKIAAKWTSPNTSELSLDVTPGRQTFDINVGKPPLP